MIAMNHKFIIAFITLIFGITAMFPLISYDEALWSYTAWLWDVHNIPPYIGTVENKRKFPATKCSMD